ncbi:pilin N-terminal domain-containing protein [Lacticaseibacillus kribbianus]|uniref:pilin N-terminal domain-containing protein n=1 Tax=Lacticaseibacillus kribbianus TaxID=2926292 RepID=UPI001CD43894|nr:pilin N-terminal domain-containing protein [Lacticaseibacillus kribbianus]
MNKSKRNKLTRMIGVCGIALGTLAGSGTVASVIQLGNAKAPVAVVRAETAPDESTARTLNIHKYQAKDNKMPVTDKTGTNKATGTTADADKIAGDSLTPMAGIQFKVYKLTADEAKTFKTDPGTITGNLDARQSVVTLTTDAAGNASHVFGNDATADGYYLVVEQNNAAVATKSDPFMVNLPLVTATTNGSRTVQYSVDVYQRTQSTRTSFPPTRRRPSRMAKWKRPSSRAALCLGT